ncbi:MAG: alpha/beta hydrolase [Novosphingobium sp.]|nr:alpha/beta hydrolase [Novosphingobium sp.]
MVHYLEKDADVTTREPLILTVPGLNNSGRNHWQSRWERKYANVQRVDLGMWDNPHRNTWVNKISLAIHRSDRPVILIGHSLGCMAIAWWAEYERPSFGNPVVGALLVAPPDVDRPGRDPRLARFCACPRQELPFPSYLVASRDDPYCALSTARSLAIDWGAKFVDAGEAGHINADSRLGDWPLGEDLLGRLLLNAGGRLARNATGRAAPHTLAKASREPASPGHPAAARTGSSRPIPARKSGYALP